MSYVMWTEEANELADVRDQLKLFADMSNAGREFTLSGEGLGCFMRRLAKELDSVLGIIEERGDKAHKARVRPYTLKQIINAVSGQEPILGSDLNKITYELREFAAINEDMQWARDAWEKFLTADGRQAIVPPETLCIKFPTARIEAAALEGGEV